MTAQIAACPDTERRESFVAGYPGRDAPVGLAAALIVRRWILIRNPLAGPRVPRLPFCAPRRGAARAACGMDAGDLRSCRPSERKAMPEW